MRTKNGGAISALFLIALFLISAHPSYSQVSSAAYYKSLVRSGNDATELELLRKVFPDVTMDASTRDFTAHTTIPLNHLFGDYKAVVYREEMTIAGMETPGELFWNKDRMLLQIHVTSDNGGLSAWNKLSILALFELAPTLKLLDAVDVQADTFTEFWEVKPAIQLSSQATAVIISNSHTNSNQHYQSLTIIAPHNDRLRNLFEFPVLLSSNDCGNDISQTARISEEKGTLRGYNDIDVRVMSVKHFDGENCEKKTRGYVRNYNALLVWNATRKKYQTRGVALKQLARFNEKRF